MYISTYICISIFVSPWINLFSLSFCLITYHWKRYIQWPVLDQLFSKNSWIGGESLSLAHIQYAKYYKNSLLLLRLSSSHKHQFCLCFSFNSSLLLKIASRGDSVESNASQLMWLQMWNTIFTSHLLKQMPLGKYIWMNKPPLISAEL